MSFICATYKNIAAIQLMLTKISRKFGEKNVFNGFDFYFFPNLQRLAFANENGLQECGLGYRAKYVEATAKKICDEKFDLESLKPMPYLDGLNKLVEFPGVGLKVADWVCSFRLKKWKLSQWTFGSNA